MNLLDYFGEQQKEKESPLASRLRPRTLDEIVGQEHIIGKDTLLYRAVRADKLSSVILLRTAGNRQDDPCQGDRQYNSGRVFTDQCYFCRKKRHGRGGGKGQREPGSLWEKDYFVY